MADYKPSLSSAIEVVKLRLKGSLQSESVSPVASAGRVLAETVRAPGPFPPTRRAAMDGTTVAGWFSSATVRTGETVDPEVEWIVMEEEAGTALVEGKEAPVESHVRELGSEYRGGDLLACAGNGVTPALVSQALVLGIEKVKVFEKPVVRVVVVGEGAESAAILNWLSGSLVARFPFAVDGSIVASVEELPSVLVGRSHLLVIASDGAPGRYRELRSLYEDPPAWFRPDFWKVDVHPCRHIGFGRTGAVPSLILPDVLYKSAVASALMLPYAAAALFSTADPVLVTVPLSRSVPVPGPFPYVLPVARPEPGDNRWLPLATGNMFSGRGAVELSGLVMWSSATDLPVLLPFA